MFKLTAVATVMGSRFAQFCSVVMFVIAFQWASGPIHAAESTCASDNESCNSPINEDALSSTTGPGLLRVHPSNPRYFTDGSGKAIYLAGHQIFVDLQDNTFGKYTTYNQQPKLNWSWYLQFAKARNLNYLRNWTVMSTGCGVPLQCALAYPMPYKRVSGFGSANDGGGKFDLNQFDEEFFKRLRSRIIDAGRIGMYVSIMLYDVYAFSNYSAPLDPMWGGNVFNAANNINGIHADINGDDWGVEFFTEPSSEIRRLQKNYVMKVIDAVNDLDNVIFEIGNEVGALQWQYEMINFVKTYEASKAKQHLVLMSPGGLSGLDVYTSATQSEVIGSAADIYAASIVWADYLENPPPNNNGKPGILDRDHVRPTHTLAPMLVWKAFARGYHYSLYDQPFEADSVENAAWELARNNIGAVVTYANTVFSDLSKMIPRGNLSSTQYALANPGLEYLIVQPESGAITVEVQSGAYNYEWFDPNTASTVDSGVVSLITGKNTVTPPFSGSAVLYLRSTQNGSVPVEQLNLRNASMPSQLSTKTPMTTRPELHDNEIGQLWRRYKPLEGQDATADLVMALLRKLIIQQARNIPYGNWEERLSHPLRTYGISRSEWDPEK